MLGTNLHLNIWDVSSNKNWLLLKSFYSKRKEKGKERNVMEEFGLLRNESRP